MPFTVRFDFINPAQGTASSTIPDASPGNDGVMTAAQAAALAGVAGGEQNFVYTVGAGDGSDFFVTLPTPRANDLYDVTPNQISGAFTAFIICPDDAPGDRTTTAFRVVTSATLPVGTRVSFETVSRT
jgi:hypothetical protein